MDFRKIACGLLLLAAAGSAHAGLIINATFDSSITSLSNAAAVESSVNAAIAVFESTYLNPITVTIDFENMLSGLGESQIGAVYNVNYQTFYNDLVFNHANPAAIAGLAAKGGSSSTDPVDGSQIIYLNSANARALGIPFGGLCNVTGTAGNLSCSSTTGGPHAIDGIVGINTSITDPPGANNGSNYSLVAVLEHEIDEVLGLGSGLQGCSNCGTITSAFVRPEDLFRFNANGTRSGTTVNCSNPGSAFFSYSGAVDITQFNNACNGADLGDWASSGTPQVQDAFGTPGSSPTLGANEIAALSAIGYEVATPEPSTFALGLLSAMTVALACRRRRFSGSE